MKKIFVCVIALFAILLTSCANRIEVTFDSNGGSAVENIKIKEGAKVRRPADPEKEGYIFLEWQLDGQRFNFETPVDEPITLVAVWYKDSGEGLTKPINVGLQNNVIYWAKVNNAVGYDVYIDGVKTYVDTNAMTIDTDENPLFTVQVVAVLENGEKSEGDAVVLNKGYTKSQIYKIFEEQVLMDDIENEYELLNQIACAAVKYDISFEEINSLSLSEDVLDYFFVDEHLLNFGKFALICANLMANKLEEPNEPTLDVDMLLLEQIYEDFPVKQSLNFSNDPLKDEKFMEFTLPYIANIYFSHGHYYIQDDGSLNVKQLLINLITDPNFNYDLTINGDKYVFTNDALNKTYSYTYEEIESSCNYFKLPSYEYYSAERSLVRFVHMHQVELETYYANVKLLDYVKNCNNELLEFYNENGEGLETLAQKLYDAYDIVLGYEEKITDLLNKYEAAGTDEQFEAVLDDALNFAEQVADLLEDTLPTDEDLELLFTMYENSFGLLKLLGMEIPGSFANYLENLDDVSLLMKDSLSNTINAIKCFMSIIDDLNGSDIMTLFKWYGNSFEITEEVKDVLTKLGTFLEDAFMELEINENIYVYDALKLMSSLGQLDYFGIYSLIFEKELTEEELDFIVTEIGNILEYLSGYNFETISEILVDIYSEVEIDLDLVREELSRFFDYVSGYFTQDYVEKFADYIQSVLDFVEEDDITYQLIFENWEGFKEYSLVKIQTMILTYISDEMFISDRELMDVILNLYDSITDREMSIIVSDTCEFAEALGEDCDYVRESIFATDFEESIDKVIAVYEKGYIETLEEKALIEALEEFPILMIVYDLPDYSYTE